MALDHRINDVKKQKKFDKRLIGFSVESFVEWVDHINNFKFDDTENISKRWPYENEVVIPPEIYIRLVLFDNMPVTWCDPS